jgi:hypothetical protein
MATRDNRQFHLDRAEQCRRMGEESADPSVRRLHVELAEFHEAEARKIRRQLPESEEAR